MTLDWLLKWPTWLVTGYTAYVELGAKIGFSNHLHLLKFNAAKEKKCTFVKVKHPSKIVYLLLGSNQHEPIVQIQKAERLIIQRIGKLLRKSHLYQTAAWGNSNQPDFINQVIIIQSALNAKTILDEILAIERSMGRIRSVQYEPRIIDIDILFYNKEILNLPELNIPHPLLHERKFVLVPLNELSPSFKHPVLNATIYQLLKRCKDTLDVKRI